MTTTNVFIYNSPVDSSGDVVNIHVGLPPGTPAVFPPNPAVPQNPTPPKSNSIADDEDPPQLDQGTNHIFGLAGAHIGTVFVYGDSGNNRTEHWVAFSNAAVNVINAGNFKVQWAEANADTWNNIRPILHASNPEYRLATMQIAYVAPPGTLSGAAGATNQRFNVLNGASGALVVRGGLFRELLPGTAGYTDHWRLGAGYVSPSEDNPDILLKLAAVTPVGTLQQFLDDLATINGTYAKAEYAWEAI